jgi:hypothetical protein
MSEINDGPIKDVDCSCYSIFSFMCMFCRLLFVILYFFRLVFFELRILITPLVSSNSSSICIIIRFR